MCKGCVRVHVCVCLCVCKRACACVSLTTNRTNFILLLHLITILNALLMHNVLLDLVNWSVFLQGILPMQCSHS